MEQLWKTAVSLVLLAVVVHETASQRIKVRVDGVGSTWIRLTLTSEQVRPTEYTVLFEDEGGRRNRQSFPHSDGSDDKMVTLSKLEPGTRYTIKIKPMYSGRKDGPWEELLQTTTPEKHRRPVQSDGASAYAATYVLLGLPLLLTWELIRLTA